MKFEPETIETLEHFSKFASAVLIKDNEPLYVCNDSRTLIVRSDIKQPTEIDLPIYNISVLSQVFKLFKSNGLDYEINYPNDNIIEFASTDGKFSQEFYLASLDFIDKAIPKADKASKYFEADFDFSFDLTADNLKIFRNGVKSNSSNIIGFEGEPGEKISLVCSDIDNYGNDEKTSRFKYTTSVDATSSFRVGFDKEAFVMLDGDYKVSVNENMILFTGEVVSYIVILKAWSSIK